MWPAQQTFTNCLLFISINFPCDKHGLNQLYNCRPRFFGQILPDKFQRVCWIFMYIQVKNVCQRFVLLKSLNLVIRFQMGLFYYMVLCVEHELHEVQLKKRWFLWSILMAGVLGRFLKVAFPWGVNGFLK